MTSEAPPLKRADRNNDASPLEMARRSCPVCGSEDESSVFAPSNFDPSRLDSFAFASRKVPEYMHHRIIACPRCDLLYSSPAPTRASLERAYHDASFDASEESRLAAVTYASFLSRLKLPDLIGALDIGAGDGAFLEQLVSHGFVDVTGVEPSKAPIDAAPVQVRSMIRHAAFRAEDFAPASLRLVTCFQTMEHVYDPLALCRAAHGLLKNDGAIFLVCHDRRALSARLLGLRSPIFDIEHLQLFSGKSIAYCLSQAGFSRVEVQSVTNHYPLRYWVRLFPLPGLVKTRVLAALSSSGLGELRVALRPGNLAAIGYK